MPRQDKDAKSNWGAREWDKLNFSLLEQHPESQTLIATSRHFSYSILPFLDVTAKPKNRVLVPFPSSPPSLLGAVQRLEVSGPF